MELYIGDRNLSEAGRECRGGGDEMCREFRFEAVGSMDGKEMICVARLPSVDDTDSRSQDLDYNGKQVAVEVEMEFAPALVRTNCEDDETTLTVCDDNLDEGRDYRLVVQFDSKPEPTSVEWTLLSDSRRDSVTVKAGNKKESYDTKDFRSVRDRDHPNRYEAEITFENISDEDLAGVHELRVENDLDEEVFVVEFGSGRDCRGQVSDGGGRGR